MKTRIRELRMEKGLSQIALAIRLELSQSTISKIENDELIPNADFLCRYSNYFKVSIDYLLFQSDEKTRADDLLQNNSALLANKQLANAIRHLSRIQYIKLCDFLNSFNFDNTDSSDPLF